MGNRTQRPAADCSGPTALSRIRDLLRSEHPERARAVFDALPADMRQPVANGLAGLGGAR